MENLIIFHVQDPAQRPIGGAALDALNAEHGNWHGTTNPCGDFIPPGPIGAGHYAITISAPGFQTRELPADLAESGVITIGLEPGSSGGNGSSGPLLPLITRGSFFALSTGEYWTAIEATDFQLFQRYALGEDITPVLAQRRDLGFNMVRVLGMCQQMFALSPEDHFYYDDLDAFFSLCDTYGVYVEFVVFADATLVMPNPDEQRAHWEAVGDIAWRVAGGLVLLEAVNEADQPVNHLAALAQLQPLHGLLCSHGSNGSQQPPVRPWWDYETMHYNDAFEWPRKVGHNSMEFSDGTDGIEASHVPILANENTRCPDRFSSPQMAFDAAAGAALLCAGSCFHSVHGKSSELWSGVELECARAWVNGARSVPLEFQDGNYRHASELETPDVLRAYQRVLSEGRAHTVLIHR